MRRLAACALLALPALGSAQGLDPTARPDQRVQLDFQHYYTLDELEGALAALAAAYPEYLRLESMGRSVGGNELWVLTVTRLADGDPELKPGLLLVGGLGEQDLWGTELTLFTVLELAQNHRRDPRVATLLERAAIYVVPSAHPDLRASLFGADGTRVGFEPRTSIDGNFEIGWRPGAAGAGPYPLSAPEAHGLARFLLEHENIAAVQVFGASAQRGAPAGLAQLEPADVALHARLARPSGAGQTGVLVGLPELALPGGTLLEFVHGHRGAFGFLTLVGSAVGGKAPEVNELFGLGRRSLDASLELAAALPRIELSVRSVARLSLELWQVDLALTNRGLLPTQSRLGALRFAAGPPRLGVSGAATLVAAALGAPGGVAPEGLIGPPSGALPGAPGLAGSGGGFEVVPMRGQAFAVGELEGGATRELRVVARGAEGAALVVEARAPRGGLARLELTLE